MAQKTTPQRRRRALALLGTTVAGCTLFSGLGIAQAQQLVVPGGQAPYIFLIDGLPATGTDDEDGQALDAFIVDERDISASVVNDDGLLEIRDETGRVVCSMDHGVDACPFELEPGRHVLTASVTDGGETLTSAPVVVYSEAPERDVQEAFDGVSPAAAHLVGAEQGPNHYRETLATFGGQPGDVAAVYEKNGRLLEKTVVGTDGTFTANVPTGREDTSVVVQTRRNGERLDTEIVVPGAAQDSVVASPIELVSVTRRTEVEYGHTMQYADVVVSGTPFAFLTMRLPYQATFKEYIGSTGQATWRIPVGDEARHLEIDTTTQGSEGDVLWGTLAVEVPAAEGEPVVAEPGTGDADFGRPVVAEPGQGDVDPGFTVPGDQGEPVVAEPGTGDADADFGRPVVAEPGQGDVDPGFTVPGGDDEATPGVSVVDVRAGGTAGSTTVTFGGTPGDLLLVEDGERTHYTSVQGDGTAELEIADFLEGQTRELTVHAYGADGERTSTFTVEGKGRAAVETVPLELVEVLPSETATVQVVLRGAPGTRYSLYAPFGQVFSGTVPEDGLIRQDLTFEGVETYLGAVAYGDTGPRETNITVAVPGTPAEGEVVVSDTEAAPGIARTTVTFKARPWTYAEVRGTDGSFVGRLSFGSNGLAKETFDGLAEGQTRDLLLSVSTSTGKPSTSRVTIEGKGVAPVAAQALELVEVLPSDVATARLQVVLRGLPGQAYGLTTPFRGTHGTVPADGLVRWDVEFPDDSVELTTRTSGDLGSVAESTITVDALPGTVAPTLPGSSNVDPGFGAPSQPGFGSLEVELGFIGWTGDHQRAAVLKLTDPEAEKDYSAIVRVDGRNRDIATIGTKTKAFTVKLDDVPGDHVVDFVVKGAVVKTFTVTLPQPAAAATPGGTDQPGEQPEVPGQQPEVPGQQPEVPGDAAQPEVPGEQTEVPEEQPAVPGDAAQAEVVEPEATEPEATEPVVAVPAPADVDPGFTAEEDTLDVRATLHGPSYGGFQNFLLKDPKAQGANGYSVRVTIDGRPTLPARVTQKGSPYSLKNLGLGSGEHTATFTTAAGIVKTVTFTI